MEATKYIKKIRSGMLLLKNLSKYEGKEVEIIILPLEDGKKLTTQKPVIKRVFAALRKYSNPKLQNREKDAWAYAMQDKHGYS